MQEAFSIILAGLIFLGLGAAALIFIGLSTKDWSIRASENPADSNQSQTGDKASGVMNEGDFHSGPGGYTPNTAYPETFYGSNEGLDYYDDEGDYRH